MRFAISNLLLIPTISVCVPILAQFSEPFVRSVIVKRGRNATLTFNSPARLGFIQLFRIENDSDDGQIVFDSRIIVENSKYKFYEGESGFNFLIKSVDELDGRSYYFSTDVLDKYFFNVVVINSITFSNSSLSGTTKYRMYRCTLDWFGVGGDAEKYPLSLGNHQVPELKIFNGTTVVETNIETLKYIDDGNTFHHVYILTLKSFAEEEELSCRADTFLLGHDVSTPCPSFQIKSLQNI